MLSHLHGVCGRSRCALRPGFRLRPLFLKDVSYGNIGDNHTRGSQ